MRWKSFALTLFAFSSLSATCLAAPAVTQGLIRFSGSVVESSCTASASATGWRLDGCPALVRAPDIDVQRLGTPDLAASVDDPSVQIRLIASNTQGRYYNQQYALVSHSGQPITSGSYLVTLTAP